MGTSALLMLWDGEQLVDASAGFADNDALATELLGFRPTRHAPLGTASTLRFTPPTPTTRTTTRTTNPDDKP
jgi:hypothetical protein